MMIGLGRFAVSMCCFVPITHVWGWRELLLPHACRGFAQQFAIAPTVTLTLGGLAPNKLKLASGLVNLMRNLGGAIGIAACATVLNDRTVLRLAEHLNTTNVAMVAMLARTRVRDASVFADPQHGAAASLKQLWSLTYREAQTMTYSDAFVLIAICFVIATAMVPLMRKIAPELGRQRTRIDPTTSKGFE